MSDNECHFVTELKIDGRRESQISQIFSNLSKWICLIFTDLKDFSLQATKYQEFRLLSKVENSNLREVE